MKTNNLLTVTILFIFITQCNSQTNDFNNFKKFSDQFPLIEIPYSIKSEYATTKSVKISKKDAFDYFGLTDEKLKFNDYTYNYDDDIKYDNWVDILPGAVGKIIGVKYILLIYSIDKNSTIGIDTSEVILNSFSYNGILIDKLTIRSSYTKERDWRDFVILEDGTIRIFIYMYNMENYVIKKGSYYLIDEKGFKSVVETNDYKLSSDGKFILSRKYSKKYLKENVVYYRGYKANSDDPMNEYILK